MTERMGISEARARLENLAFQRENNAVVTLTLTDAKAIRSVLAQADSYTHVDGSFWDQPTAWAYFSACRALHWREGQLKHYGILPYTIAPDDPLYPPPNVFAPVADAPPEPIIGEPDAPPVDNFLELHMRVAAIISRKYLRYSRNDRLAHDTAMEILEEVQHTYEQLANAAGLQENGHGN